MTRLTTWLSGFTFKFWLIVCAVLIACLPVSYCKGRSDGRAIESAKTERAARKAVEKAREADEATNTRREVDRATNTENERKRNEATVTGGRIGRDCERLRQAGADLSAFPACR